MKSMIMAAALLASSATADARTLSLAFGAGSGSVLETQILEFIADVERGGIEINYFPDNQLGNMSDTLKSAMAGRVDIWSGSLATLTGIVPEITALSLPFLFDDDAQAKCVVPQLQAPLQEVVGKRVQLLHLSHVATQDVSAPQPVHVPADIVGLKMRVAPLEGSIAMFRAAGATVISIPVSETPAALQTGLAHGVDFEATTYVHTGAYKVAKYHSQLNFNHNLGAVLIGPRTWAALSASERQIIVDAASKMDYGRGLDSVSAAENEVLAVAIEGGAEVVEITEAQRDEWRELGRSIWPEVMASSRGQTQALLDKVNTIKAQCRLGDS